MVVSSMMRRPFSGSRGQESPLAGNAFQLMNLVVLKIIPEPNTRSFTVPETRTPPGSAFAMIPRRYFPPLVLHFELEAARFDKIHRVGGTCLLTISAILGLRRMFETEERERLILKQTSGDVHVPFTLLAGGGSAVERRHGAVQKYPKAQTQTGGRTICSPDLARG